MYAKKNPTNRRRERKEERKKERKNEVGAGCLALMSRDFAIHMDGELARCEMSNFLINSSKNSLRWS